MKENKDPKAVRSPKKMWVDMGDLKSLIDLIKDTEVAELEVEKDGVRVRIKKSGGTGPSGSRRTRETVSTALPGPTAVQGSAPQAPEGVEEKYYVVFSPIVGTFYRAPSPDAEPYVNVGDIVKKGQILCIVEAMKLMNEIEAEMAGKIVEILVQDAQPVEYGEVLFKIEPI